MGLVAAPRYVRRVGSEWRRTALVVEDHALTRTLLATALKSAGFEAVAVSNSPDAVAAFQRVDPDVLITDVDLGSVPSGLELASILKALAPHLAVLVLSNYASSAQLPGGRVPDGAAFLSKTELESTKTLLDAVEAVLRDQPTRSSPQSRRSEPLAGLTRRQLHLLRRMAEGWSNAEIAEREDMSVSAVEKATTRMFTSLGLRDDARRNARVVAVRMFIEAYGPPRADAS